MACPIGFSRPMPAPSAMQTHSQGPLEAGGSLDPLTEEEREACKAELEEIKEKTGWNEPNRGPTLEDESITWRFGTAPNYTLANLEYFKYKTKAHKAGSIEELVENLTKTWEMEMSHKPNLKDHTAGNHERFQMSSNGGDPVPFERALEQGNYNNLMETVDDELWPKDQSNWDTHEVFHKVFPAFSWEVLEVTQGPPDVKFTWRHFGRFTGEYKGIRGEGQMINLVGEATATVDEDLKLCEVEITADWDSFLKQLGGMDEIPECPGDYAILDESNYCKEEPEPEEE